MPSSSESDSDSVSVPDGHVVLVLFQQGDSSFYLQIPLEIINSLCLKPRKYLLYLGWCILGTEGELAHTQDGRKIGMNGGLDNQGTYYYRLTADLGSTFLSR